MLASTDTHIFLPSFLSPSRYTSQSLFCPKQVRPANPACKPLLSLAEGNSPSYLPAPNRAMALPHSQHYLCHSEFSSSKRASISCQEEEKG